MKIKPQHMHIDVICYDLLAREKTTKPNSPPWERRNPILTLSCIVSPTRGPIAVIISVLMTIKPAKSESTFGHSRKRICKEKSGMHKKKMKARIIDKNRQIFICIHICTHVSMYYSMRQSYFLLYRFNHTIRKLYASFFVIVDLLVIRKH